MSTTVFDAGVNMGIATAVRLLQLALGNVVADGKLGSETIAAVNAADEGRLIDEFKARLAKYYCELQQPEFLLGWLRRAVKG